MSGLPEVGHSITNHLLPRGRRTWRESPVCPKCGELCFPRGVCLSTGLCWTCQFPRPTAPESSADLYRRTKPLKAEAEKGMGT